MVGVRPIRKSTTMNWPKKPGLDCLYYSEKHWLKGDTVPRLLIHRDRVSIFAFQLLDDFLNGGFAVRIKFGGLEPAI